MRKKLGRWRGPISVPILFTDQGPIADSYDIARFADAQGEASLFSEETEAETRALHELSEAALAAGRALGLQRILDQERDALDAFVPPALLRAAANVGRGIAAWGIRRTLAKYAPVTPDDPHGALLRLLDTIAQRLQTDPDDARPLSFADITLAEGLAFVVPPSSHLKLSDPSRRAYTWDRLPAGYEDVFAWRDSLYASRA